MMLRQLPVLLALMLTACSDPYQGPVSDHFDGGRFHDAQAFDKNWPDLLRYWWERKPGGWKRDLTVPPGPRPPANKAAGELRLTFVNHASVLIQADGLNILTDPIWSERASPVQWAGARRFRPPGIRFEDLPGIDMVIISHNHYDHFDLPTLKRLKDAYDPWFIVGLGQSALLKSEGIAKTAELDWWQPWRMPNGCALWGAPSRHWSSRGVPGDRNKTLWLSYVIETQAGPVYFAGDTGYDDQFVRAREKFGAMRAALLPIGAYKPRWLTDYQHMDPAQAVRAHDDLQSAFSLGIHYGTFELSEEGQLQPVLDLEYARAARGLTAQSFAAPEFGAGYDVHKLDRA